MFNNPSGSLQWHFQIRWLFTSKTIFALFAFASNAKSFAIGTVFLFFLPYLFSGQTCESVLQMFYWLLLIIHVTSAELISLDSLKSVCLVSLWIVIRDACDPWHLMCFSYFRVTSIKSIRKIINAQKLGNKMENDRRFNG